MMWPPSILHIRVPRSGRRDLNLWLPVFLIWPFALLLGVLAIPLVVVTCVVCMCVGKARLCRTILTAGPRFFALFCSLRGLSVRVGEPDGEVNIALW